VKALPVKKYLQIFPSMQSSLVTQPVAYMHILTTVGDEVGTTTEADTDTASVGFGTRKSEAGF